MKDQLKQKLEALTLKYIEVYPEEYNLVVKQIEANKEKNADDFASVGNEKMVNRKIHEIPATLDTIFITKLTADELAFMKGMEGKEIARWFATRFPEFSASKKI